MERTGFDAALVLRSGELTEKQTVDRILACNEATEAYGLRLTEDQALALTHTRTASLKDTRRIEFGSETVNKLILAVCDSPYVTQENYEETLHEWICLFYDLKNATWDRVSDDDLIGFMATAWNGTCCGSMELLTEQAMELAEHIHCGNDLPSFLGKEE